MKTGLCCNPIPRQRQQSAPRPKHLGLAPPDVCHPGLTLCFGKVRKANPWLPNHTTGISQHGPNGKQLWYFTARDGSPILTAARLWDEWRDRASGTTLQSCTMIITNANAFVGQVHDRMPALLAEKDFEPWLSGEAGRELLAAAPEESLRLWPVSKRVNSSRADADDLTLIEEIQAVT